MGGRRQKVVSGDRATSLSLFIQLFFLALLSKTPFTPFCPFSFLSFLVTAAMNRSRVGGPLLGKTVDIEPSLNKAVDEILRYQLNL